MGMQKQTVGGGPATGLATDFVGFLQQALNTGTFGGGSAMGQAQGANPMASTQGIAGILNDILAGGAGKIGGNMNQMIQTATENQVNNLRARYATGGGMSYGTPAAYGEAVLRSQTAPQMMQATGQLQMGAIMPILQMILGLSGKGISQREDILAPNNWIQGLQAASGAAQGVASMVGAAKGG